jgi:hypothetical protein
MGMIGILNVGAGDTKLIFDKSKPAECIRSGRIVTDMLRRGYALLIEVTDANGVKAYTRVREFREDVCEYIIADFDPTQAAESDEDAHAQGEQSEEAEASAESKPAGKSKAKRALKTRAVPAAGTTGIAVSRSAGG